MLYYFRYAKLEQPPYWILGSYGVFFDNYKRVLIYVDRSIESINFNPGDYGILSGRIYLKIE